MRKTPNKRLFMLAALLATSSTLEFDGPADHVGVNVRATFGGAHTRQLVTPDLYRIEIERVAINSDAVDVRPRDADDLDRMLAQLDGPTVDVTPGLRAEPDETDLVLTNARFEGRVYDETGARLPVEGLGISGNVPLNVHLHKTGDKTRPLDVRFEVPSEFFDGIDWAA